MENKIAKGVVVGAGIAAVIAGTYFLYGAKDSVKNRKKVKAWMFKAKGEILEQLENLSEVSEEKYHKIVKEVSEKYKTAKKLEEKEVAEFIDELKGHWENIAEELGVSQKKLVKAK